MTLTRLAYRRLTDLYVVGREVELLDGNVMWLQVMNPFERDEAQNDCDAARHRVTLALKDDLESDDFVQARGMFVDRGREAIIEMLMETRKAELFSEVLDEIRVEEGWREKFLVLQRTPDLATVPTESEREYVEALQEAFAVEVARRLDSAIQFDAELHNELTDDELFTKYIDWLVEQRGATAALAEYRLSEIWFGARVCAGVKSEDGSWDHSACEGHALKVFDSKEEVRHLPENLLRVLIDAFGELEMSEREGKA